ncbi:MAG: CPBP family intramembrane glutamic endopeptidase [Paludibacter sp.]
MDNLFKFKGMFATNSPFSKLLLLLGSTIVFTMLGLMVWTAFHGDINNFQSLKWLQLAESIGMFVLPPLAMAYLWSEKPMAYLHADRGMNTKTILLVVTVMIVAIPFINLLGDINHRLVLPHQLAGLENWMKSAEADAAALTEKLMHTSNISGLMFNIFLISMAPALGEELFFRGALQGLFTEWKNIRWAIWLSAILFSAIHIQFYGFLPRMLMGALFGYMVMWSGSIWPAVLAHFINNAMAVLFYYLKYNGYQLPDIDTVGTGAGWWLGVASAAVTVFCIFIIKKQFNSKDL